MSAKLGYDLDPLMLEGGGRVFRSARFGLKGPSKPVRLTHTPLTEEERARVAEVRRRLDSGPLGNP